MSKKYRIKEKNGRFFPQERSFWIWVGFFEWNNKGEFVEIYSNTLIEAEQYIEFEKKKRNVIIHKIN